MFVQSMLTMIGLESIRFILETTVNTDQIVIDSLIPARIQIVHTGTQMGRYVEPKKVKNIFR